VRLEIRNFLLSHLGGGNFQISANWPASYANVIDVMIEGTPDFVEWSLPEPASHLGGGAFSQTVSNSNPRFFYRAFPALRR
jgi:hypothetical protein